MATTKTTAVTKVDSAVFRRRLPEELQIMPYTLRVLEFVGLWGSWNQFPFFVLFMTTGTMVILFPKAFLGIGHSEFAIMAKGIAEFIFEANIYLSALIFSTKRASFVKVVNGLAEFFHEVSNADNDCYDLIRTTNVKIRYFWLFMVLYCATGPIIFCIPSATVTYLRYWDAIGKNLSEPLVYEIPMEQEFYGLDIRKNFIHNQIFLGFSFLAYCASKFFLLVMITTPFIMIKYNSLTYQLVCERIRKLPHLPGGPKPAGSSTSNRTEVNVPDLAEVVRLHRQAYEITQQIEDIVHLPVALEYFTCVMFYCMAMFYISTYIDFSLFNIMVLFLASLMETFGYSYLGSELSEEAAAVGTAIYDLPWYDHSVELQRYYRLIIQRTQRTTGIFGLRFFLVQLTTFANVMQMSYSYFLVLKDVLQQL
ncbi:olfactory receptor [Culex quinquefasciatus]|uniref:Odorant receptor n=1 Tax=Culex quinquefasciatus TaxID=7176 RepID=B0WB02_CULQU|nr:olfactory receptor [Culex quinquefasciatus]|eukprot:XP_001845886.1 olfactory receptor [Culex quinquefasciatus]